VCVCVCVCACVCARVCERVCACVFWLKIDLGCMLEGGGRGWGDRCGFHALFYLRWVKTATKPLSSQ